MPINTLNILKTYCNYFDQILNKKLSITKKVTNFLLKKA